ncbi:MAG: zinc-dependent metalloprotease [Phycisphaerales bacterium]|nr:zinc-dependent metalloprotease [Phycisphaerales bacterium]
MRRTGTTLAFALLACVGLPGGLGLTPDAAFAQRAGQADDFPPFDKTIEGLTRVVSTADGASGLYDLYKDEKTGKLLGVLPRNYDSQLLMIACTVSGGDSQAGVMGPTYYAKWRRYDKQLALVMPNFNVRTTGDRQARDSVNELFTDRVLVTVPIVTETDGRPVIDLGSLMTRNAGSFFGFSVFGGYGPSVRGVNASLVKLTKAKSFPKNFVVEYELPESQGQLIRLSYSVGALEGTPGYQPRQADPRVGYFYDFYQDYAKPSNEDVTERYINRWYVEKADPSLKLSPPKQPIVWYIEHTTPVKFRRYVREGIGLWNEAFRDIGIDGAIVVYQQDADTGAHMDKDPEDSRYNFFRWNSSDQSYAIGPSRTNPETGEILDADVVWHQGLTRSVRNMLEGLSDDITETTFTPETLAFFAEHPDWDPRVRLAPPGERDRRQRELALAVEAGAAEPFGEQGHPLAPEAFDHTNHACRIGNMLAADLSLFDAALAGSLVEEGDGADLLDGIPEDYIGPMIRYISCHEVGHCLGLQHNMAASTIRELSDVHSGHFEGASSGSVMDYIAANINYKLGPEQGPYATPTVGPYDRWAIAYGYGPDKDLEALLKRSGEPDLIYLSQMEMSSGSDPRNMTWDNGADNLDFCESRIGLVNELRAKLIGDIVDDGESWAHVRRRYGNLLGTQLQCLSIASRWIGGTFSNNDFKSEGGRAAIEDVPAAQQRRALQLIIGNAFDEQAFGLTPDLVRHMGKEYWWDDAGVDELMADPSFTVHDMVGGVQAAALSMVLNPGTLRRVYDNEFRTSGQGDMLTLAEVVGAVSDAVWDSAKSAKKGDYSAGSPMISSFDRNLQREHTDRLITLALMERTTSPAMRTISSLAAQELRRVNEIAGKAQSAGPDAYTNAHLADIQTRIGKALDAAYVVTR